MKKMEGNDEWAGVRKALGDILHEKGRSARDVSLALGKTHNYVHNILNRTKYRITKQTIREILDELNVNQSEFDLRTRNREHAIPIHGSVPSIQSNDGGPVDNWIPCYCNEPKTNVFAMVVSGSSMEPVYRNGDILIIEKTEIEVGSDSANPTAIESIDGRDVVCVINGATTIKRMRTRRSGSVVSVELVPVNSTDGAAIACGKNDKVVIQGPIIRRVVK